MGLRDWFAKNVAGVEAYGASMGRSNGENGLALGRALYWGHGTYPGNSEQCVFEDEVAMAAHGYKLYCADPANRPPPEDRSRLSILTRAAGVAFAAKLAMNAAGCFSKEENMAKFRRALGASTASYLKVHSPDLPMELLLQFVGLNAPPNITTMLNLDKPGSDDFLEVLLRSVSGQIDDARIAFQRGGVMGFDMLAIPLAEQTVVMIQKAGAEFGW